MRTRSALISAIALGVVVCGVVVLAQDSQQRNPLKSESTSRIVFADSSLGSPAPTEAIAVTVEGSAVYNPQTGYYTYSYTLTSDPSSQSDVRFFALQPIPRPLSTTAPAHWEHSRYLVAGTDSASVWQVVDSGTIPPDWVDTGNVPPSEFDLEPGQSVSGFSFTTAVPPIEGGVSFIAQGFDTLPGNAESWGDDYPYPDILQRGVTGLTVGPGSGVGVQEPGPKLESSRLHPAQPNPSAGVVALGYTIPMESNVSITIFDVAGKRIRRLVNAKRPEGTHSVTWNGRDEHGQPVPAGVYFYKLAVDGQAAGQRRVVLYQRSGK